MGTRAAVLAVAIGLVAAACGGEDAAPEPTAAPVGPPDTTPASAAPADSMPGCADVIDVEVTGPSGGPFTFAVTVRSDDEGWEAYADAWDVLGPGGEALATRVLTHPHVEEQPFTRSQSGVEIPAGVTVVTVRAHHSVGGHCGATRDVELPG